MLVLLCSLSLASDSEVPVRSAELSEPASDLETVKARVRSALDKSGVAIDRTEDATLPTPDGEAPMHAMYDDAGAVHTVAILPGDPARALICHDRDPDEATVAHSWCAGVALLSTGGMAEEEPTCDLAVEDGVFVHPEGVRATLPAAEDWSVDCEGLAATSASLGMRVDARVAEATGFQETAWLLEIGKRTEKRWRTDGLLPRGTRIESQGDQRMLVSTAKKPGPEKISHFHAWRAVPAGASTVVELHVSRKSVGIPATKDQREELLGVLGSLVLSEPETPPAQ